MGPREDNQLKKAKDEYSTYIMVPGTCIIAGTTGHRRARHCTALRC